MKKFKVYLLNDKGEQSFVLFDFDATGKAWYETQDAIVRLIEDKTGLRFDFLDWSFSETQAERDEAARFAP